MIHDPTFTIVHTAKDVEYTVTGFRTKNKDELNPVALTTLKHTNHPLLSSCY